MSRRLRTAVALFFWLFSLVAQGATLWFAAEHTLYRSDGTRILQSIPIDRAGSIAADASGGVWVSGEKKLAQYNASGILQSQIDTKTLSLKEDALAATDPIDGSLWLVSQKKLLRLSPSGVMLGETSLPGQARALAVNLDRNLAVLGEKRVWIYSGFGAMLADVDLRGMVQEEPKSLALDPLGGLFWLGGEKQLTLWDVARLSSPRTMLTLPKTLRALALDPKTGALWAAGEDILQIYNRNAALIKSLDLKALNLKEVQALAHDPATSGMWLSHKQGVSRFTAQGDLTLTLATSDKIQAIAAAPFNPQPSLSLLAPASNLLTNDPRPAYRLQFDALCQDSPCGLPPAYTATYRLDATLNGLQIGTQFSLDPQTGLATYIPGSTLPQGSNLFSAQLTDQFGHLSNRVQNTITVDSIAPQLYDLAPSDGSVFNQPGITISGKTDDPQAIVKLDGIGQSTGQSFSFPVTLQEGINAFRLSATDPAGNSSSAYLKYTYEKQTLSIKIAAPLNGASVNGDRILVSGTFQGPPNTGISINGVTAQTSGNSFYANNVPLNAGANTLTVTATTPDGKSASDSIVITSAGPSPFKVTVTPQGGIAPLTIKFSVTGGTGIQKVEADFDGNGTVDYTSTDLNAAVAYTYAAPGIYQARIAVTDGQNTIQSQTVAVVVSDLAQMERVFQSIWSGMNGALAAKDKARAMQYLTQQARAKYGPVFDLLLPKMPQIMASISPLQRSRISDGYAEYAVKRPGAGGKVYLYLVYFLRDQDGIWRLDEM